MLDTMKELRQEVIDQVGDKGEVKEWTEQMCVVEYGIPARIEVISYLVDGYAGDFQIGVNVVDGDERDPVATFFTTDGFEAVHVATFIVSYLV